MTEYKHLTLLRKVLQKDLCHTHTQPEPVQNSKWKDGTEAIDIPNVKECRTGNTSFKRSSVENDTQSFNQNRASIITEEIFDLAIVFF